ncbi:MAG: phosphomethylpyrimidine synthase ThiC [Candidatus Omnitrophota bacterium]|nr:phosphomethylpyrimidine synthase ThiC [Candidatus Omnitrophota bacterium]MBU1929104.1 phosphomethylpyrimidine synthase ThiC [Candidatus Omnitrophota bacterium]MBU1929145.1 phosphomethylpyrimidine synthase ThiC [Candidatus Omnitrophota bacterium]MBU2035025.1 phosphomethylpyrimidine synthase ThiC [Candidatus Omnitrophota bacterium]
MTQIEYARKNILTSIMKKISSQESLSGEVFLKRLKEGKIVIPLNHKHKIKKPCAVGLGLKTKINANIGTSPDKDSSSDELEKLAVALKYGADTVMDLSVGSDIPGVRRRILKASCVPVGTVPIYEIAVNAQKKYKDLLRFDINSILDCLETQASDGVDFFTIHCGVTKKSLDALNSSKRLMGIVSRGGAMIASWIKKNKKENPFYEYFDRILDIAYRYDVTLSLGDGLRPGSIFDATDNAQICELKILGELKARANKRNVQVIIEGPGHVPLDQIRENILLEKKICRGAPFYVLGPLVTDIAPGYDHITSAIGAAMAAGYGADFLCYVTPSEHLRHPSAEDVREGVIASRIAAHAADIVKGLPQALEWDRKMSLARKKRDWQKQIKLAIDPQKAKLYRLSSKPDLSDVCTMCGKYCSIKLSEKCLKL